MYFWVSQITKVMFLRDKKNKSGSVSVQIIQKSRGKYKVLQTIGNGKTEQELTKLNYLGKQEIERLSKQPELFVWKNDLQIEQLFSSLNNASIRICWSRTYFWEVV